MQIAIKLCDKLPIQERRQLKILEKIIRIIYYIECIDNDKNTKIVTPSIKGY